MTIDDKSVEIKAGARRLFQVWDRFRDYGKAAYWEWHRRRATRLVKKVLAGRARRGATSVLTVGSHGEAFGLSADEVIHLNILMRWLPRDARSVVGDAEHLPFDSGVFDACLYMDSVINYCRANRVLGECVRVLCPGGIVIVDFDNGHTLEFWGSEAFSAGQVIRKGDLPGVPHDMWFYSAQYMGSLLRLHGFQVTRTMGSHYLSCRVQDTSHGLAKILMQLDPMVNAIPAARTWAGNLVLVGERTGAAPHGNARA